MEQKAVAASSKDVIESYIFASSGRSLSIYSERLLVKIVDVAQKRLLGADFKSGESLRQLSTGDLSEVEIEIPIRSLLGSDGDRYNNYQQAKDAVMELMRSPYFLERQKMTRAGVPVFDKDGNPEMELYGNQILNNCYVNVKPGYIIIKVNEETWKGILDFSKGFRRYDLTAALKLKLPSSLRLFRLLSNLSSPITYSIDELKMMWHTEDKYKEPRDFVRRIIEPAKKELDEKAPWSFSYVCNRKAGERKMSSVTFIPERKITNFTQPALDRLVETPKGVLDRVSYEMLINDFGFTDAGLKNNIVMLSCAKRNKVDMVDFLEGVKPVAVRANNPQGYVIRSLKNLLKEKYGEIL